MFRTNTSSIDSSQDLYLNIGNPNVYDLVSDINSKCSTYLTCAYDNIKNKITFTRIYAQTNSYYNMYINLLIMAISLVWTTMLKS